MYLPYLRGKQYELIALRELSDILVENKGKISPIIEPVKDSSTLKNCVEGLADKAINFSVIINPAVGDLKQNQHTQTIINYLFNWLNGYQNWQIGVLIDKNFNPTPILELVHSIGFYDRNFTLIHNYIRKDINLILREFNLRNHIEYNVINYTQINDRRRYHRDFERNTIVSLDDFFASQVRNVDYLHAGESEFSEEHLYYQDDGFKGFSDFLTIGEPYSDGGFLPYAVAIHISYPDDDKKIIVKHFVSDSNSDASDIGGKFAEALEKLITWYNGKGFLETIGIKGFRELHKNSHFPGLGSVKKLSIMHHIELVLNLIKT